LGSGGAAVVSWAAWGFVFGGVWGVGGGGGLGGVGFGGGQDPESST